MLCWAKGPTTLRNGSWGGGQGSRSPSPVAASVGRQGETPHQTFPLCHPLPVPVPHNCPV